MRIIEVRDGFIKFEAKKNIALSSFIQIDDTKNSYIAQVIQIKRAGEHSIAYAKILFLYNGAFNEYDKSLPAMDSELKEFDYNLLKELSKPDNGLLVGHFIANDEEIIVEKDALNKKTLISADTPEFNKTIVTNLAKQFKNSIIIDTLGLFDSQKHIAGVDFKLPLNTDALEFLFEDCLNDATSDSKNLIKEIFQDLADYSKTVPFVPFGTLKAIVDDMVDKSHVFKLLVLKNKLAKFDKLGYFAANTKEAENLYNILQSNFAIIDLSRLDQAFLNRYLSIILSSLENKNSSSQIFVLASNTLDKKNLKKLLTGNCNTTFITHPRFKFINEIKKMFTNFIIEPSFTNNEVFKKFSTLLKAMPKDSYLIIGEGTSRIPLISTLKEMSFEQPPIEPEQEELSEEQVVELEKALEENSEYTIEDTEESNPSIEAIEKKSEDLIEKVSEEVQADSIPSNINLFEDEENEEIIEETFESESSEVSSEKSVLETTEEEEKTECTELTETDLEDKTETLSEDNASEENIALENSEEFHTQVDIIQTIEIPEGISDYTEEILDETEDKATELEEPEVETFEQEDIINNELEEEEEEEEIPSEQTESQNYSNDIIEETEIIPLAEETEEEFDEIIELDDSEISDTDIIVELDENPEESLSEEDLDRSIIEDVDKVFTTIKEDTISDSDLDFIDELNNETEDTIEEITLSEGMEELDELQDVQDEEDSFLEPLEEVSDFTNEEITEEKEILETRSASTPIVPVYGADIPAEDIVISDDIEQGDTVVHAKYGNGVVEKMIKYGTKTLYSINFDNVGRRLLDPTLTELKKN